MLKFFQKHTAKSKTRASKFPCCDKIKILIIRLIKFSQSEELMVIEEV